MIAQQQPQSMAVAEYLEWEPLQDIRYEFVWGQVYAMTGGSVPHNLIALNLYTAIRGSVRQRGWQAFVADVKLQVNDAGLYRYPDVMVSCVSRDRSNLKMIHLPHCGSIIARNRGSGQGAKICRIPKIANPPRVRSG